jgi:hypothetical protein
MFLGIFRYFLPRTISRKEINMAKFKDKQSGCVVEFLLEHDIKAMLAHPEYDVVEEEVKPAEPVKAPVAAKKAIKED